MSRRKDIAQAIVELIAKSNQWAENPSDVWGLPTGYMSWNKISGGLHQGEETVVGARTSHGKTAFLLQCVFSLADYVLDTQANVDEDLGKILFVSPEMKMDSLLMRYAAADLGIPTRDVLRGRLDPETLAIWQKVVNGMARFNPFVTMETGEDGQKIDVNDIFNIVQDIKTYGPVALVVVDYLQLIYSSGKGPYEKATEASQKLKSMSLSLNIPLIVASQCRRPSEAPFPKGGEKQEVRPYKEELRDSGDIEQSADNILMLYNPPEAEKYQDETRLAQVFVDKQRNGPVGFWSMKYQPRLTRFVDLGNAVHMDGES